MLESSLGGVAISCQHLDASHVTNSKSEQSTSESSPHPREVQMDWCLVKSCSISRLSKCDIMRQAMHERLKSLRPTLGPGGYIILHRVRGRRYHGRLYDTHIYRVGYVEKQDLGLSFAFSQVFSWYRVSIPREKVRKDQVTFFKGYSGRCDRMVRGHAWKESEMRLASYSGSYPNRDSGDESRLSSAAVKAVPRRSSHDRYELDDHSQVIVTPLCLSLVAWLLEHRSKRFIVHAFRTPLPPCIVI